MSQHTVTYENYKAGHPWYYFLGGPILKPSIIRMSVETAGYGGYLQEDIEAAAKKNEPQRTTALREIKDKVMISFKRDLSRYRQLAHQLRQERNNNPDRCKENCCHQIDTGMSLKHNHLYNDFAHLLLLDSKLNAQPDLFENFL